MSPTAAQVIAKFNRIYPKHMTGTPGEAMTPEEIRQLAEAIGFSPTLALQISQISHGESGFMPGIVQTDPGDGNIGYGLLQVTPHAWGPAGVAHMNKLGGIDAMRNPVKNMEMAKWLSDQAAKGGGNPLSPWYGTRYLNRNPGPVHSVLAAGGSPTAAVIAGRATGTPGPHQNAPAAVAAALPGQPADLADAIRRQALANLYKRAGQGTSSLFQTGVLSTQPVDPSAFLSQPTVPMPNLAGTTSTSPTTPTNGPGAPRHAPRAPTATGTFKLAPGANRPGVGLTSELQNFLDSISGHAGHELSVGTGTNHNQFVAGEPGVQSWHWTGHAADLPQPYASHQGDIVAAHALVAAGIHWPQALKLAEQGGVHNVTPTSGPFAGHRIQVIWKTMVGGNHYNHVHVGIM